MSLSPGQALSFYEILGPLGAGGMGEVYRARDTRLGREVAIKVLPDELAGDQERLRRFEREAQTLASLNHPNVAGIHGLDQEGDQRFIAMELVPGEDLARRLAGGPLPVREALDVCRQIAEGLEAAHEAGVVHRDLKPANVRVTPEGVVKVLDFGLAKPTRNGEPGAHLVSQMTTEAGRVLGTPTYMSPEQARGKSVDRRTDIWALGCVLYECLTGRRAFAAGSLPDLLAAILGEDPDWSALVARAPGRVTNLVRRTLNKDPRQRLRDIGDVRLELQELLSGAEQATDEPTVRGAGRLAPWLVLSLGVAAGVLAGWSMFSPDGAGGAPAPAWENPLTGADFVQVTDFEGSQFDAAISPDGTLAAFVCDRDGPFEIRFGQVETGEFPQLALGEDEFDWTDARLPVRAVGFSGDGSEIWLGGGPWRRVRALPLLGGTVSNFLNEEVVNVAWSRDGTRIVYHERVPGDPIYVADPDGANSRLVLPSPEGVHQHYPTFSWDGQWIFVARGHMRTLEMDLWRVGVDGEGLEQLTSDQLDVRYPTPIDDRTILYSARDPDGAGPWLWAVDVETKVSRRAIEGLQEYSSVSASRDGMRLLATVQDPHASLWSVPIVPVGADAATEGDAEPFADLGTQRALAPRFGGTSLYYLSSRGSGDGLWRRHASGRIQEIWRGSDTALLEPAAVSPDGEAVALLLRRDGAWLVNVLTSDGAQRTALSRDVEARGASCWSPDGEWIVTGGNAADGPGLFKIPTDGGTPVRLASGEALNPVWSPKGDLIVYSGTNINVVSPLLAVRPDGEPVELPKIEVFRSGERSRFLPDGSALVFMRGLGFSQDFWLLDLATLEERRLTELDPSATMRTFDITPDGERIVFDRLSLDSDIVLIERQSPAAR